MTLRVSLRRRLRLALVVLLVAALPGPALAAARMAGCGGGQAMPMVATMEDASPMESSDKMVDDDRSHSEHGRSHASGCDACAGCVGGAAMPMAPLRLPLIERTAILVATDACRITAHIGEGLERPPPSFLA